MCTVTLSYDGNNALAQEKLAALLATGLFITAEEPQQEDDLDIQEVLMDAKERVMQKESYTPEEAFHLTMKEIQNIYQVEYAL